MLRALGYRDQALPFDWVYSTIHSLRSCFQDHFKHFHTGLKLNRKRNGLIDSYGFIYVHDYPSPSDMICSEYHIGEGMLWEYSPVGSDWEMYYPLVKSKYDRRVKRFLSLLQSSQPIIILCEYGTEDVKALQQVMTSVYQKTNLFFINSTREDPRNNTPKNIFHANLGSDPQKWRKAIEDVVASIDIHPI